MGIASSAAQFGVRYSGDLGVPRGKQLRGETLIPLCIVHGTSYFIHGGQLRGVTLIPLVLETFVWPNGDTFPRDDSAWCAVLRSTPSYTLYFIF